MEGGESVCEWRVGGGVCEWRAVAQCCSVAVCLVQVALVFVVFVFLMMVLQIVQPHQATVLQDLLLLHLILKSHDYKRITSL